MVALPFLLACLLARAQALGSSMGPSATLAALALLAASACAHWPRLLGPGLALFGAGFFLCGFHSYRTPSLALELATTALAIALATRAWRDTSGPVPEGIRLVLPFFGLYALTATFSLLLLPPRVLEHRAFIEGAELGRALATAYPKDPLYPIASVARLWTFLIFAAALSQQPDARALCRWLFRGLAASAVLAVVLGLLDFLGLVSLTRYNLSHLFYGAQYRRLQSSFGNPSWFACYVACALPFVWLAWSEARRHWLRGALAASFPLATAALYLSGARAAWLALGVLLAALAGLRRLARAGERQPFDPGRLGWAALLTSIAVFVGLAAGTFGPGAASRRDSDDSPPGRLEGLSHEFRIRGLGLSSPRRVAAEYALELAKQKPLLGLGYESFNMHLRAQLGLPGSAVAGVVNTALAGDPAETVFDDSHNTYLQALTGTGLLGLLLWLVAAGAALAPVALALRGTPEPTTVAVALGMVVFHFYGLFQGMAYLPVVFLLFHVQLAYAMALAPPLPGGLLRLRRALLVVLGLLALASVQGYALDSGYRSLKRALGVAAYLPDETEDFEGFYRPESGSQGEFRWSARRAVLNFHRAAPFRLAFTCEHPDLEREPVVVTLRYDNRDAGSIVCRRRGTLEQRFVPDAPGALWISVSRTFRPGGSDRRDLGVAVSAIRWD